MDTRYLKTLIVVVETASFSKAARILHLTQSAVSQRIKFLEDLLNYTLVDRSGPSLTLTAAGGIVLDSARRMLAIEDSLLSKLQQVKMRSRLALCCTPTFGTVYLPEVLNRFMQKSASSVDLNFLLQNTEKALEGVRAKEFDIAIVEHGPDVDLSQFRTYPLPEDELIFVSVPEMGLSSPEVDLEDLLKLRLFARKDGCSSRMMVRAGLAEHGKSLDDFTSMMTSDDLRLTCQSILSGGGISYMSKSLVQEYLRKGQMVGHYVKNFPHSRCRTLVMDLDREKDALLHGFALCVFEVMDVAPPF